jgi:hypothetical protein
MRRPVPVTILLLDEREVAPGRAGTYVRSCRQKLSGKQHMGTATRPAQTSPASWDTFSDVDAFVDAVLTKLAAMAADDARPMRSGPKPALTGAPLRKTVMALWCVCFCGMQWRAIGQLCEIPFGTLFTLFGCWTRLGLWRRRLDRLRRTWRIACGDDPEPSAIIIDSPLSPFACKRSRQRNLRFGEGCALQAP